MHDKNNVSHDVRINVGRMGNTCCLTLGLKLVCLLTDTCDAGSSPHEAS